MTTVYLDTCSIQRPLDSLDHTRLRLEAEAVLGVLAQIHSGKIDLVSSTVLELETLQNPLPVRREHGLHVLERANTIIVANREVEERATHFIAEGVRPMDALHLACAEAAKVDFFCTCDDHLLRKSRGIIFSGMQVVSPIVLAEVIEQ